MQGCILRFTDAEPFDLSWRHLIGTRNPRLITWVLNASINSVVTPDLRKLWGCALLLNVSYVAIRKLLCFIFWWATLLHFANSMLLET